MFSKILTTFSQLPRTSSTISDLFQLLRLVFRLTPLERETQAQLSVSLFLRKSLMVARLDVPLPMYSVRTYTSLNKILVHLSHLLVMCVSMTHATQEPVVSVLLVFRLQLSLTSLWTEIYQLMHSVVSSGMQPIMCGPLIVESLPQPILLPRLLVVGLTI